MYNEETGIYTCRKGVEIKILPINELKIRKMTVSIRDKFIANKEPIDPPLYIVAVAGGGKQRRYHTRKSMYADDGGYREKRTVEEIEEWEAHQNALARFDAEVREKITYMAFREGTEFEMPEDDEWKELLEHDGISVPTHPELQRALYLEIVLLDPHELAEIAQLILTQSRRRITQMTEDAANIAESFRGEMEESSGTND